MLRLWIPRVLKKTWLKPSPFKTQFSAQDHVQKKSEFMFVFSRSFDGPSEGSKLWSCMSSWAFDI